jgi:hypothetical protein
MLRVQVEKNEETLCATPRAWQRLASSVVYQTRPGPTCTYSEWMPKIMMCMKCSCEIQFQLMHKEMHAHTAVQRPCSRRGENVVNNNSSAKACLPNRLIYYDLTYICFFASFELS